MYRIYNVHSNENVFVGTYEELVKFCNSKTYKMFLQMIDKKDYTFGNVK